MLMTINTFTYFWLLWGVIFAGIEGTAVYVDKKQKKGGVPGGTLSALVWRFIGKTHPWHRVVLAGGWIVLTSHFFFHIP